VLEYQLPPERVENFRPTTATGGAPGIFGANAGTERSVMSSQIWKFVVAPALLASVFALLPGTDSADRRLDLVVRPGSVDASSSPLRGSLSLRSLDRAGSERIALGSPYETLSLPVPAGAYTLEWQPEVSFETEDALGWAVRQAEAPPELPRVVVIAAGHATTVHVRVSPSTGAETQLATLAAEEPFAPLQLARR
jgi:hypothetical protein